MLDPVEGAVERGVAVGASVVSEDGFNGDAVIGEELVGSSPEGCAGHGALIVEGLGERQPAVGVDGRVEVGVADPTVLLRLVVEGYVSPEDPPAAAVGDATELLNVDVDELARSMGVDPADDLSRRSVDPPEAVEAESNENSMDGRGGNSESPTDAGRAELEGAS